MNAYVNNKCQPPVEEPVVVWMSMERVSKCVNLRVTVGVEERVAGVCRERDEDETRLKFESLRMEIRKSGSARDEVLYFAHAVVDANAARKKGRTQRESQKSDEYASIRSRGVMLLLVSKQVHCDPDVVLPHALANFELACLSTLSTQHEAFPPVPANIQYSFDCCIHLVYPPHHAFPHHLRHRCPRPLFGCLSG